MLAETGKTKTERGVVALWPSTSLQAWEDAPMHAFWDWLAALGIQGLQQGRQLRGTSVKTYAAMFHTWMQFLQQGRRTVLEATPALAQAFFEHHEPPLEPVSRRRYLQLLDRVYLYLQEIGWPKKNPMAPELSKERALDETPPVGLEPEDQERLLDLLREGKGWKGARDRALVALLWGAGLRNNEALALCLDELSDNFTIQVKPQGVHRNHQTLLLPSGPWRSWMVEWLEIRRALAIPGPILCPSTLSGKAYSPSGVFRRLDGLFEQAGVASKKRGANVLRTTFARHALTCGEYSPLEVREFLGHEELRATTRHLPSPSDG